MERNWKAILLGGVALVLAACSQPTVPASDDTGFMTCNTGVVIRTGQSCDNQ